MKRKFLALIVAGITFMASSVELLNNVLFIEANAADYIEGTYNSLNYKEYSDHIAIAPSKVTYKVLNIPSEIDGLPVTVIEPRAFQDNSDIVSVNFPDSIIEMGELAFYNCDGIETFVSPKNVTYISGQLFDQCDNLKEVIFSDNVTSINGTSIENCKSIERIVLPLSLEEFKFNREHFTSDCPNLKEIIIDDRNRSFSTEDGVLFDKLKKTLIKYPGGKEDISYTVPNSVVSIDNRAFYNTKLVSVEIPESVKIIGSSAFSFSRFLTDVSLPSSISEISNWAFSWTGITSITIPNTVKSIGEYSFAYSSLIDIELPISVESVGENAFISTKLKKITINNYNCLIYDKEYTIHNEASIYGGANSTARSYAEKYGRQFVTLSNNVEQSQGGSYRFSLSSLGLKSGDILNINVSGDAGDTIQVYFYYNDKDGNAASSLVGGLGGTVLDSNGKKTVSFTAPNDLNSISVRIVYNKSLPIYTYDIRRKEIVTQPTTTATTTAQSTTTTTTSKTTSKTTVTTQPTTTTSTTTINTENKNFQVGKDDYSFENYKEMITVSGSLLSILENNINNIDWKTINTQLYEKRGHCYGMSVVQILVKSGVLNVTDIDSDAETLYDVNSPYHNENVNNILNYYHLLQCTRAIEKQKQKYLYKTNQSKVTELMELADEAQNGGCPVLVCFDYMASSSDALKNNYSGHAVVAYGIEYGGYYNNQYDCRILISDPNVIGFKSECCIYINTTTYAWQIPYYQEKYYSCTNNNENYNNKPYARISLITNDINLIDYPKSNLSVEDSIDSSISIESGSSSNYGVAYYDTDNSGLFNSDTFDLIFYSGEFGGNSSSTVNAILPTADVAYEYFERSITSFDTTISYTNSELTASVSSGSCAIYQPDESVEFVGENSDYTLSMVLNEGYYSTDWFEIEVDGENANKAKLSVTNGGYIISSDSFSDGIMIKTSNRNVTANLGIITEYDSVFIYEIDETTIGIKVDTNNDGIYETNFEPTYLGDANLNGSIGIVDAVLLQKYLLNNATINKKQYISMDMNMDGVVNVFDLVFLKRKLLNN